MPVSADIYSQIQPVQPVNPLASLAQAYQVQGLQANLAREQRAEQQNNALMNLVGSPDFQALSVPEKAARLQGIGAFQQAGQLITSDAAANKDRRETEGFNLKNGATKLELIGQTLQGVNNEPTYQFALKQLNSMGIPTPNAPPNYDPAVVNQFIQQAMSVKDRAAQQTQLAGQAITMRGQDMADARSRDNAALTNATTMRGQDMADRRAQAAAATGRIPSGYEVDPDKPGALRFIVGGPADPNTKPAGGKPLNDTQAKALLFGTRMQESNDILNRMAEAGTETPGMLKSTANAIPNWALGGAAQLGANALQSSGQQQVEQAQRDFVNAVLRRESGAAIATSEFDSAAKQYFPQPGDSSQVKEQKRKNREIAIRGLLAEVPDAETRVPQVRGSTGGASGSFDKPGKTVTRTGMLNGRKVVQYSDGTIDYAN